MKKNTTLLLVGGAAVALYLYSKGSASAGPYSQGSGSLPSGGNAGGYPGGYPGAYYGSSSGMGATRPRFRH